MDKPLYDVNEQHKSTTLDEAPKPKKSKRTSHIKKTLCPECNQETIECVPGVERGIHRACDNPFYWSTCPIHLAVQNGVVDQWFKSHA